MDNAEHLPAFQIIKSEVALMLFDHFIREFTKIGPIEIYPHKTMVTITNSHGRVAYITQAGKFFIDVVFPFKQRYDDNLCFRRIQEVPGRHVIYHHFRMLKNADVNGEVRKFMRVAYKS